MSENNKKKASYDRPKRQGDKKPYGRPAARETQGAERRYGKPTGSAQGQSGERRYGKPAFDKGPHSTERKPYGRPAGSAQGQSGERRYGKPAFDKGPQSTERKPYGRPAGSAQGQSGERRYGKPAFDKGPHSTERKSYGRPAGPSQGQSGERRYGKPAFDKGPQSVERKPYGRPAGSAQGQSGERRYGKPAFQQGPRDNERKPYGRPAGPSQGQSGDRRYGKPAFDKGPQSAERRPYGQPASARRQDPQNRFSQPSFVPDSREHDHDRRSYGRSASTPPPQQRFGTGPARPGGSFQKPAMPRPASTRFSPRRTDFRNQGGDQSYRREETGLSADARRSAMLVLNRVLLESGFASLSLDEHFEHVRLSQRDKRLCTRIVYLTLEHLNAIDFALDRYLENPEGVEKRVRNILRLSAAQILQLDRVPDSAAVNEAVKLTRDIGLEELTGLVNGVLRNLIRGREELKYPAKEEGLTYYRVMKSLPDWYSSRILEAYGDEVGDQLLCYDKTDHYITIRPNFQRIAADKFEQLLEKKVWDHKPGILPEAWYVSGASDIAKDEDFLDGLFSIQGEGSMVAAMAVKPKLGAQVLDTCAAPGGKSAFLAEHMQGTGRVQAWDVHEHRVELIQAQADRLRLYNIRPAVRDALVYREQLDRMMDFVMIDAPCTGTGMLHEKPDLRHNLKEESLRELTGIQARLLDTCSQYVKPGAVLVYATCSVLPEENEEQVKRFLEDHPDFVPDMLPEEIPGHLRELAGEYGLQLLPHRDGMEGFFVARMKRV